MYSTSRSRYFLVFFVLFAGIQFTVYAQNTKTIEIVFKVRNEEISPTTPIVGAQISVYERPSNKLVQTQTTPSNGNSSFTLDLFKDYAITFTKKDFATKKLLIDAGVVGKENKSKLYYYIEHIINMYAPSSDRLGAELIDKPFDRLIFDTQENNFGSDKDYMLAVKKELSKLTPREKEKLRGYLTGGSTTDNPDDKGYKAAVASGDKLFNMREFAKAKDAYNEALILKPNDKYATDKLNQVEAATKSIEDADLKYKQAILKADNLFLKKDYAKAKEAYNSALALNPKETYPKNQLKEIEKQLNNANSDYVKLLADANKALKEKKYLDSKQLYSSALRIKPFEQYPKDQLAKVEGLISQDSNLSKEQDSKYNDALKKGKEALDSKDFEKSKEYYTTASDLKPQEKLPKTQLAKLDELINAATNTNDKYLAAIKDGEKAFAEKNYDAAKKSYGDASLINPQEAYPKKKIVEIDKLIIEMKRNLSAIENLMKRKNDTASREQVVQQLADLKSDQMAKIKQLQLLKKAHAKQMANMSTKYSTLNPLTKLFDLVDTKEVAPDQ